MYANSTLYPNPPGSGGPKWSFPYSWKLYKTKVVVNLPSRSVNHANFRNWRRTHYAHDPTGQVNPGWHSIHWGAGHRVNAFLEFPRSRNRMGISTKRFGRREDRKLGKHGCAKSETQIHLRYVGVSGKFKHLRPFSSCLVSSLLKLSSRANYVCLERLIFVTEQIEITQKFSGSSN